MSTTDTPFTDILKEIERSLAKLASVTVRPNDLYLHSAHLDKIGGHVKELRAWSNKNRRGRSGKAPEATAERIVRDDLAYRALQGVQRCANAGNEDSKAGDPSNVVPLPVAYLNAGICTLQDFRESNGIGAQTEPRP